MSSEIPCINYTGGERTRTGVDVPLPGGFLGRGAPRPARASPEYRDAEVAVVYDRTPVGRGYAETFSQGAEAAGMQVVASAAVDPLADSADGLAAR